MITEQMSETEIEKGTTLYEPNLFGLKKKEKKWVLELRRDSAELCQPKYSENGQATCYYRSSI